MRLSFYCLVSLSIVLAVLPVSGGRADWAAYRHDSGLNAVSDAKSGYDINYSGVLWSAKTLGWVRSSPVAADLDADGRLEVVAGSDDGRLYVYRHDGTLWWNFTTGGRIRASPAVGSLNLDKYLEIVVGSEDGSLYALTHDGRLLWSFKTRDAITTPPVIAELFWNDRGSEVVYAAGKKMHILGSDGVEMQSGQMPEDVNSPFAVGDVNNDASAELLIAASDNTIYVYDKFFNVLKRFTVEGTYITVPVLLDVDGNGIMEAVFASMGDGVYSVYQTTFTGANTCATTNCLEKPVQYLRLFPYWKADRGKIMPPLSIADLDGDGRKETVLMAGGGTLHVFDERGFNVMTYGVNGEIAQPPSLADLDGDGKKEIIFGAADGNLYIANYPQGSRMIVSIDAPVSSSPAVADLGGDGTLEIILGADDNSVYAVGNRLNASAVQAAASLQAAIDALSAGDRNQAFENLSAAINLYLWLSDQKGLEKATSLMDEINSSMNADIYLQNANNAYRSYKLKDAMSYAVEAARLYQRTGDIKKALAAEDLQNKVKAHSDAEARYKNGLLLYNSEGPGQKAMDEIQAARAGYLSVGYAPGVTKAESVLIRMEADDYFNKASFAYSNKQYGPSKVYAGKALELYSEINYDGGMNASVVLIGNATREMSSGGGDGGIITTVVFLVMLLSAFVLFAMVYGLIKRRGVASKPNALEKANGRIGNNPPKARIYEEFERKRAQVPDSDFGKTEYSASQREIAAEPVNPKPEIYVPQKEPAIEASLVIPESAPVKESIPEAAAGKPEDANSQKALLAEDAKVQTRESRIKSLRDAARVNEGLTGSDPTSIVLLIYRLRKSGLIDTLSMQDAMDVLTLDQETIEGYLGKLVTRGWVRLTEVNGEQHIDLNNTAVGGLANLADMDEAAMAASAKRPSESTKEAKIVMPVKKTAANGKKAAERSIPQPEAVHDRLLTIEERLSSIERLYTENAKARKSKGK